MHQACPFKFVAPRGITPRGASRAARCPDGPLNAPLGRVCRRSITRNRSAHPRISLAVCSLPLVANIK